MQVVADLHLHSKYSRAVSQDMVLPIMREWAKKKGIDILTTGDWTHPLWFREIRGQLKEKSEGLFQLTTNNPSFAKLRGAGKQQTTSQGEPLFLLTVEVSSIYSQGGKLRRVHNLIFAPSFETAEKVNRELQKRSVNLLSDGRPMMGVSARDVLQIVLEVDERCLVIPAHCWTPWFSLFGSNSGFDSIEECFGKYTKYIYGIETGLSSDPEMNWRIAELDNLSILSFSDAHSPAKMGREATVFGNKNGILNDKLQISNNQIITYNDITSAIKQDSNSKLEIGYTIEFYPEEGKYHYTGHRNCKIVQRPEETKKNGTKCPVCGRTLTVGVMHRVEQLTQLNKQSFDSAQDRQSTNNPSTPLRTSKQLDKLGVKWIEDSTGKRPPFVKLVPLLEIIAEALSSTTTSLKVKDTYHLLIEKFGSEISILLKTDILAIDKVTGTIIAEGIKKVRNGAIVIAPGYDGEYGKVKIWPTSSGQSSIDERTLTNDKTTQLGIEF